MRGSAPAALIALALALTAARADGPTRLDDPLLERLVGEWQGEGQATGPDGRPLPYADRLTVAWTLGHTWLQLDLEVTRGAPGGAGYAARGFLTRAPGGRYALVWADPERRPTIAEGPGDAETLTLRAPDPSGGAVVTTYRLAAADRLELRLELELDGARERLLDVTYRRR
ncbi:MAG: heme-binding beta-barrel domain-containing protein [Planctomycetes bacterium]|nr:heme-binding beta-barrel domain-containing protein [Planctomycetota bacterium]